MSTSGLSETLAIINRFPIDLELDPGTNFTERTTYTGIYNISGLGFDMSFRVQCAGGQFGPNCCDNENFYGPSCSVFCIPLERVYICDREGREVCLHDNREPSTATNCSICLQGWDLTSNCSTCSLYYDEQSQCTLGEIEAPTAQHVYLAMTHQPTAHCVSLVMILLPTAHSVYLAMTNLPTAHCVSLAMIHLPTAKHVFLMLHASQVKNHHQVCTVTRKRVLIVM